MIPSKHNIPDSGLKIHHYHLGDREKIFLYDNDNVTLYNSDVSSFLDDTNPNNDIYKNVEFYFDLFKISEEKVGSCADFDLLMTIYKNEKRIFSCPVDKDIINIVQKLDNLLSVE